MNEKHVSKPQEILRQATCLVIKFHWISIFAFLKEAYTMERVKWTHANYKILLVSLIKMFTKKHLKMHIERTISKNTNGAWLKILYTLYKKKKCEKRGVEKWS